MRLIDVEELYAHTVKYATPHRHPNFDSLKKAIDADAEITGSMVFLEEYNTGYDGILERWILTAPTKNGGKIQFQMDVLPGSIRTA